MDNMTRSAAPAGHAKPGARYHHGDLARAAVAAALEVLGQQGAGALSLAEVARRVGVSAAALYRHFADREALLAALAAECFARFEVCLRRAAGGTPRERVRALTAAYLAFAARHPGRYALMFGAGLDEKKHPALEVAGDRALAVITGALADDGFGLEPDAARAVALQAWGLCHGLATLRSGLALDVGARELATLAVQGVEALVAASATAAAKATTATTAARARSASRRAPSAG